MRRDNIATESDESPCLLSVLSGNSPGSVKATPFSAEKEIVRRTNAPLFTSIHELVKKIGKLRFPTSFLLQSWIMSSCGK